jgi:hypothetical protein
MPHKLSLNVARNNMNPKIDLRRYKITTINEVSDFLDVIISQVPQMVRVMKKLQLENQSLRNHNSTLKEANDKLNNVVPAAPAGDNVSVSDRLAGKTWQPPTATSESDRLAQLQAAGNLPPDEPEEIVTDPALLPDPSKAPQLTPQTPGEMGQLAMAPSNPNPMNTAPEVPPAPALEPPIEGQEAPAEIVDDGMGDVDTAEIDSLDLGGSQGTPPANPAPETVTPPSAADTTPVGTRVAEGQAKQKPLKSYNRTDLNALATELKIADPETYESNSQLRKAIEAVQAV